MALIAGTGTAIACGKPRACGPIHTGTVPSLGVKAGPGRRRRRSCGARREGRGGAWLGRGGWLEVFHEPVTDARLGQDVTRVAGLLLYLPPQVPDVRVDRAFAADKVRAPELACDLLPAEDPSR